MYQTITKIARTFFSNAQIYKYGFNWSPMYRRTTAKVTEVSNDLLYVKIKIPLSYKNKNFVGTIFGGSLFSATDPLYMIQLINILGKDYVVWDKAATIKYKKPARSTVYCEFIFKNDEIKNIKSVVAEHGEFNLIKNTNITDKNGVVISELSKTIYVANKSFYKEKLKLRRNK
ncbi:DUF4442 domain-containing protein [Tamlana sp. PT2-4]|uniref:DUF4442 domain-containing protein n=2 Tax=Neotamlana laminarinivorans TaxID=2883124 RepID=A0A9X1I1C6_9FLAO|nr:DUF4442 domain-containing protein [Tamlana laminarinivorans]